MNVIIFSLPGFDRYEKVTSPVRKSGVCDGVTDGLVIVAALDNGMRSPKLIISDFLPISLTGEFDTNGSNFM